MVLACEVQLRTPAQDSPRRSAALVLAIQAMSPHARPMATRSTTGPCVTFVKGWDGLVLAGPRAATTPTTARRPPRDEQRFERD